VASHEVVVVLCTVPETGAARLVDAVLELRLAACVQSVGPVRSRYRWQGGVEESTETLLVLKTARDRVEALRAALVAHHPYQVPEVLELPVSGGHEAYLQWVFAETRLPGATGETA